MSWSSGGFIAIEAHLPLAQSPGAGDAGLRGERDLVAGSRRAATHQQAEDRRRLRSAPGNLDGVRVERLAESVDDRELLRLDHVDRVERGVGVEAEPVKLGTDQELAACLLVIGVSRVELRLDRFGSVLFPTLERELLCCPQAEVRKQRQKSRRHRLRARSRLHLDVAAEYAAP